MKTRSVKLFHLFPLRHMDDHQFYERAFVPEGRAITRDKLRTRIQVALFEHIALGNVPLEGGGVIPLYSISTRILYFLLLTPLTSPWHGICFRLLVRDSRTRSLKT